MQLAMMEERGISARTDCGRLHVFGLPMRSAAPEIMAVSGHSTLAQVQVYIEEADRERLAASAMDKVSRIETETEVCKPSDPRLQTGS